MRYLQILNWVLMAAATVLATVLSVVCLLFWIYRHEPIMQASFPSLLEQTLMFLGLSVVNAAAALTLHYRKPGFWLFQFLMGLAVAATLRYYLPG